MTKSEVIDKIKKCLALSSSSNEHEAATALRQARLLMEKHGIGELEMLAAGASEAAIDSVAKKFPPHYESALSASIGAAFGCQVLFTHSRYRDHGQWKFIGCGAAPEIASYAFHVLNRQVKQQRAAHIKSKLKRCKPATKVRRADLFCDGWVRSVISKISDFAGTPEQDRAIEAYLTQNYPETTDLKSRDRNSGREICSRDLNDYAAGRKSGAEAELNRGVSKSNQELLA